MLIHLAVFLITLSGLIFEVGLTRIYSATIWYHFAFIAISVALLGWGLGGLALHVFRRRIFPTMEKAALLALIYGCSIVTCLWIIVEFRFRMELLPLYFTDLLGASLGALAVTFLLEAFGGETAILLASVAPLIAAAALSRKLRI